ncbi:alkaline shock response membrane anchor protein AmaP [Candidatus Sumerlaeota bacterium]|nr:alkaline shock response membrane anchor protein AmaP [Candidatus Sumerlaeota bacterium]
MIALSRKLCLALILFFLFLIGIYALSANPHTPGSIKEFLTSLYYFFLWQETCRILFWALVTLLPLFYVFLSIRAWSTREKYVIKGKEGSSVISQSAIVRSLISAVHTVPNVVKVKPVIQNELGGLNVKLIAYIKLEQYIPNLCERIRSRAKSTLTDVLGIDRITRIDVNIEEVKLLRPPLAERIQRESASPQHPKTAKPQASPPKPLPSKPIIPKPAPQPPQAPKPPLPTPPHPNQPEKKA